MYTDEQHLDISRCQYAVYELGDHVVTEKFGIEIGYVSDIKVKLSGENTYIVTDMQLPDHSAASCEQVKAITVLFTGSTADPFTKTQETFLDWVVNDIVMAVRIGMPDFVPTKPTIQLRDAANTLQEVLLTYPNARVTIYGHSLGSMKAQAALSGVAKADVHRIQAAYLYNGPNIYKTLNKTQHKNIVRLNHKVFNYVDTNDFIGFGYDTARVVGQVFRINSENKGLFGIGAQHMWGGYRFDDRGNLVHVNGDLVSTDIAWHQVDIDGDGEVDIELDDYDLRTRNLLSPGKLLAGTTAPAAVDREALRIFASHLAHEVLPDINEMQRIIQLCITKLHHVRASFDTSHTRMTDAVKDVFKKSGKSYVLYDLFEAVAVIMSHRNLLEAGATHAELAKPFADKLVPLIDNKPLPYAAYQAQLDELRSLSEQLLMRIKNERTYTLRSMMMGGTPSLKDSWDTIEQALMYLINNGQIMLADERKWHNICDSLSAMLNVLSDHTHKTVQLVSQLLATVTAYAEGQEHVPTNTDTDTPDYREYLEHYGISDDVGVLRAFDKRVANKSDDYAKMIAETYYDTISRVKSGLDDWLAFGGRLDNCIATITRNYPSVIYTQERRLNAEGKEERVGPVVHWGELSSLYPERTKETIAQLSQIISPTFMKIQNTLWRARNTHDNERQLVAELRPVVEESVYQAFDLDGIIKGLHYVALLSTRLANEIDFVSHAAMPEHSGTVLTKMLHDVSEHLQFYATLYEDCFGDHVAWSSRN